MGEITLAPIALRNAGRKSSLTEEQKAFIIENAPGKNIPAMASDLGVPYHLIDSFVKAKKIEVCKKRKPQTKREYDYEADGFFCIDHYNPVTI
ncbi:MAG: hypothetical protein GXC72_00760 [Chitinophagaceae bacterium]|nr:hypothetical protein [Chitinophagaceae bacterium]